MIKWVDAFLSLRCMTIVRRTLKNFWKLKSLLTQRVFGETEAERGNEESKKRTHEPECVRKSCITKEVAVHFKLAPLQGAFFVFSVVKIYTWLHIYHDLYQRQNDPRVRIIKTQRPCCGCLSCRTIILLCLVPLGAPGSACQKRTGQGGWDIKTQEIFRLHRNRLVSLFLSICLILLALSNLFIRLKW